MNARLEYKARILKQCFTDFYREVDGYWVYGPLTPRGYLTAKDLILIAELLNEANRLWDKQITDFFAKEQTS